MVLLCCVFKGLPRCLNESTMARFSFVSHKGFSLTWLLSQTQAGNPKITEKLSSRYGDVFTHIWYPHCQSLNCDWKIIAPPNPRDSNIQVMQRLQIMLLKQPMELNMQFYLSGTTSLSSLLLALKGRLPYQPETMDGRMTNTPMMGGGGVVLHVCSQEVWPPLFRKCPTMPSKVAAYQTFLSSGHLFLTSFSHTHPCPLPLLLTQPFAQPLKPRVYQKDTVLTILALV